MAHTSDRSLDGSVAIVTGAGSGIGRATAVSLAGAGAAIVLVGRRIGPLQETAELVAAAGGQAILQAADVTDHRQVEKVANTIETEFGCADVLVNSAGMNVPVHALDRVSVEDWKAVVEVNLHGPFIVTRAILPLMKAGGSGTIVNISSMAGVAAGLMGGAAYSAAKRAVISFTESVNLSERRHGIRACTICPGEVETPILDTRPVPPSQEARASMLQPEDIASTVLHVVTLPQRATIELITMRPTVLRDQSAELRQLR
jgi:NADP-dependent 3-hydroxy acid dehydrogenase YdfG